MEARVVLLLARHEFAGARRNRWFVSFALAFAGLAVGTAALAIGGGGPAALAGFDRTGAGLLDLVLWTAPLMGLVLGSLSLAQEREGGSLLGLMAQPVTAAEVATGKFLGLVAALASALLSGFGLAGIYLWAQGVGGSPGPFVTLAGLALLLTAGSVGLGLLFGAVAARAGSALGAALMAWLLLVVVGDLGLMGSAVAMRLPVGTLLAAALANPLEAFRLAGILALRGNLEVLGPAGHWAVRSLGSGLLPLLVGLLAVWAALPAAVAGSALRRRGAA